MRLLLAALLPLIARLRHGARRAVRRMGFGIAAGGALLVAIGFFTAAGLIALMHLWGPVWATLAVGGVYLLLAVIAAVLARGGADPVAPPPPTSQTWTALAEALILGITAGRNLRKKD